MRRYYRVDVNDPSTFTNNVVEPYLNPAINEELAERYGVDIHGDQLIRIVWAPSLRTTNFKDHGSHTEPYEGRKYPYNGGFRLRITTGFVYKNDDDNDVTVPTIAKVPKNKSFVEQFVYDDLAARKFVVEMKFSLAQMVQMRWAPEPGSQEEGTWCVRNGKRYRISADPRGEYIFCKFIQTPEGDFRSVTSDDVRLIHETFDRALNETEAERLVRKQEEREELDRRLRISEADKEFGLISNALSRTGKKKRIIYGV